MNQNEKFGRFAKYKDRFLITDIFGRHIDFIEPRVSVVHGQFKLVTKKQVARVIGLVTKSMLNKTTRKGENIFEFNGYHGCESARFGDVLLEDVDNPADRWSCPSNTFWESSEWSGVVDSDLSVTYVKTGKPLLALEIPDGTTIVTFTKKIFSPPGCLLAMTDPNKGDFYLWTKEVVDKYVSEYIPA